MNISLIPLGGSLAVKLLDYRLSMKDMDSAFQSLLMSSAIYKQTTPMKIFESFKNYYITAFIVLSIALQISNLYKIAYVAGCRGVKQVGGLVPVL